METSGANSDTHYTNSSSVSASGVNSRSDNDGDNTTNTWYGMQIPGSLNPFRSPISFLLDYSGILRSTSAHVSDAAALDNGVGTPEFRPELRDHTRDCASEISFSGSEGFSSSTGEVSIQIIGNGEQYNGVGSGTVSLSSQNEGEVGSEESGGLMRSRGGISALHSEGGNIGVVAGERVPLVASSSSLSDGNGANELNRNTGDSSSYQRYDIQQIARWIEQILPFSLLLLVVFIRQHLQGFFVTIWISAIMFKSNDIVRKQTTLKGDRRTLVLVGISMLFILHVIFIYWWYQNDDILYPLIMIPPKTVPSFWHTIFIILVNDTMMRQAAMAFKCLILIYYKNGRGHNFRRQGQMLTLVEYALLLYRALLPTPVWYRFFLNKDYGSLFSSLTTGLYLTFKLTSVVEKVKYFLSALKALSRKEVHYGVYATLEQINAAGDMCAICQEQMHAPIILRCKHIFCEECVSEWFERERTCPLCRALVKPAEMRTFGDGSTSLLFQLF